MNSDFDQAVLASWAAKNLPARLDTGTTAKVLGFAENDIQILMAGRKLIPLGDPAPTAPKWFAAMEVIRLAEDIDWLNRATKEVSKHWPQKRSGVVASPDVDALVFGQPSLPWRQWDRLETRPALGRRYSWGASAVSGTSLAMTIWAE